MKTKVDKKVNKIVKSINRQLKQDVFKDRFWIRQVQKQKNEYGMQFYLFEMRDRLEPNRNSIIAQGWIWGENRFLVSGLYEAINDFIIKSDFWSLYNGSIYDESMDDYAAEFNHYRTSNLIGE